LQFGIPEDEIDIEDTEKLLELWQEHLTAQSGSRDDFSQAKILWQA
jgi:hypothetical protein